MAGQPLVARALGLLGFADGAAAGPRRYCTEKVQDGNSPQAIFDVTAKFEALATIINTVGFERKLGGDAVTQRNLEAAAREELLHYQVLVDGFGAKPNVTQIWVPDRVFSSRTALLNTTQAGDGIFINAYLIATTAFGHLGYGREARIMSEFMGVEAVHRAVARQSLGLLGNDRAFIRYTQNEQAAGQPDLNKPGFTAIGDAITRLQGRRWVAEAAQHTGSGVDDVIADQSSRHTARNAGANGVRRRAAGCG